MNFRVLAAGLLTLGTLTACSSTDDSSVPTNAHGMVDKKVGETAVLTDNGADLLKFEVNSITPHIECSGEPSEKGQWVKIDLTAHTTAEPRRTPGELTNALVPTNWSAYTSSAERLSNLYRPTSCTPPANWAANLPPSSTFTGAVALDLPNDVTSIVIPFPGATGGWEWPVRSAPS